MKKIVLIVMLFMGLTGCQSDDGSNVTQDNDPVNVDFEDVMDSELSGEPVEGGNFVIDSNQEWNEFKVHVNSAYPSMPDYDFLQGITIDFSQYTVIAVMDQWWGFGGNEIEITSIEQQNDMITVKVVKTPNTDENVPLIHSQPFHIVMIPATNLPVTFQ